MDRFSAETDRPDPYKNFRFVLRMDGRLVAGFSRVSGLASASRDWEGEAGTRRELHGTTEYEPITFERGVTHDVAFETWANALWMIRDTPEYRKELTIEARNEAGETVVTVILFRCRVSEFQALPELDASANAVAIEMLRIEHEGWERR